MISDMSCRKRVAFRRSFHMIPRPKQQHITLNPSFPIKSRSMYSKPDRDLFYCHWHPDIELIYVEEGMIDMRIDKQPYTLCKGDICMINANQIHHGITRDHVNSRVHLVVFSYDVLGQGMDSFVYKKYIAPLKRGTLLLPNIVTSRESKDGTPTWIHACQEIVQQLLDCSDRHFIGRELLIQGYFFQFLSILYQHDLFNKGKRGKKKDLLRREIAILTYFKNHFTEDMSVPVIADLFGFNEDYFYRLFKNITGQTPIHYMHHLRILYAKQLLETTDHSITEISSCVGFDSVSYFSKIFKKLADISPRAYRKRFYGENAL